MISALRKMRARPVATLVAVTNTLIGDARETLEVDALFRSMSWSGLSRRDSGRRARTRGQHVHRDEHRRLVQRPAAEHHVERLRWNGLKQRRLRYVLPICLQRGAAPSAPPAAWPSASTAAFIAPAEVPETPSIFSHGSSSRRSITPQVKAPCEPPP